MNRFIQYLSSRNHRAATSCSVALSSAILHAMAAIALVLWSNLIPAAAVAETVLSGAPISIQLDRSAGRVTSLKITATRLPQGKTFAEPFTIGDPDRLVVDITGYDAKLNTKKVIDDSLLKQVRIGSQSDRTRIVFDLSAPLQGALQSKRSTTGITINFSSVGGSSTAVSKSSAAAEEKAASSAANEGIVSPTPAVAPSRSSTPAPATPVATSPTKMPSPTGTPTATPTKSPSPSASPSPSSTPSPSPSASAIVAVTSTAEKAAQPGPAETIATTPSEPTSAEPLKSEETSPNAKQTPPSLTSPQNVETPASPPKTSGEERIGTPAKGVVGGRNVDVTKISYQLTKAAKEASLVIDISQPASYSLKKLDEDLFALTIEHAQLAGKHLTLEQFPPDTFSGFEVVIAKETDVGVEIEIYTEDGAKLQPFFSEGKLWVKALP